LNGALSVVDRRSTRALSEGVPDRPRRPSRWGPPASARRADGDNVACTDPQCDLSRKCGRDAITSERVFACLPDSGWAYWDAWRTEAPPFAQERDLSGA
jgi:hypothetical protein